MDAHASLEKKNQPTVNYSIGYMPGRSVIFIAGIQTEIIETTAYGPITTKRGPEAL